MFVINTKHPLEGIRVVYGLVWTGCSMPGQASSGTGAKRRRSGTQGTRVQGVGNGNTCQDLGRTAALR